ncbi:hypothetical protein [Anaerovirgula multivorans]|uniref:hypothetical protein n=1 Tax=Anaerovirgula multivorans TaxID=312168 RepID=UPI001A9A3D6C|nr:hypothetical protein [Anaerovirgula multivorans]
MNNIESVISKSSDEVASKIDKKLEELQHSHLRLANSKADYDEVVEEIYRLRGRKRRA